MQILEFLNLIRIKDWLKNIIIFFPLIFSGYLFNHLIYIDVLIGFFTFSIVSSLIYVLNDILDIDKDKLHPSKKFSKPLASKNLSIKFAYIIIFILTVILLVLIYFQPLIQFGIISYLFLNLIYNFGFKNVPYLEFSLLAYGYVIRINTGSNIIQVDSSMLMLFSVFFLGIYFLLIKRIGELNHKFILDNQATRNVLKYYNLDFLKILSVLSIILISFILLIYILTININLILSFIFSVYFLFKYFFLTKNNSSGENPINLILNNKILLSLSFLILICSLVIYI